MTHSSPERASTTKSVDIVPAGERNLQMRKHAYELAQRVVEGPAANRLSLAEAVDDVMQWVERYPHVVSGGSVEPGVAIEMLMIFVLADLQRGKALDPRWEDGLPADLLGHELFTRLTNLAQEQAWTFDRAKEWLDDQIALDPNNTDLFANAVDTLFGMLARDATFSDVHRDAVIAYIRRHDGELDFGKRDLKDLLNAKRKDLEVEEPTDHFIIASTLLAQLQVGGQIRFHLGQFWQWNGSRYVKLGWARMYMNVARHVKGSLLVRRNGDYKAIVEVLEHMCTAPLAEVDAKGINFANGFVGQDLRLFEHDPKYGATFTLPFEYHRENATRCSRFLEFLASCWGMELDFEQRVLALQEAFAATLFGIASSYQRAILLFGRAGTGKTVLLKILRSLLPPDAIAELGPQHWGMPFHLVDLIGKTANICGELPENGLITGNIFKEVVEGSPVRDSFKNKDGFTFTPTCAHWFASNYLPLSRDSTRGFIRRWLILDFNNPVKKEDIIENLADMIVAEERQAIAAWALEGLPRLVGQRGYTKPSCHDHRIGQVRRINNPVAAFLEDVQDYQPGDGSVDGRELYKRYVHYAKEMGRSTHVNFERFSHMLEDLNLKVERRGPSDYMIDGLIQVAVKAPA